MAEIVILGAGLTGLSTAYHLEQLGFTDYQLYEKESDTGGLCRSVKQDGFTFDYTGHLLHISDPYFKTFIEKIFGFNNLKTIQRRSLIYSNGIYTPFPFQVNMYGLPPSIIADCIEGFVARNKLRKKSPNFLEWATTQFGSGITKHFFEPYQKKLFACDLADITASWTSRFVPKTTLREIIHGALQPPKNTIGYNAQFYYPKEGGINRWVKALKNQIKKLINTDHCVETINLETKRVTFTNGTSVNYKTVVNTLPLDQFLKLLKEPSSSSLKRAAQKLRCNSVLNFNLGLARPNISDAHWIYLPEKDFPHYRMGFYHNFSQSMVPQNCSSIYGEISYFKKDRYLKKRLDIALEQTKKLLNITSADIIIQKNISIERAYVIYDFWRERNLSKIHQQLVDRSIHSIGRYGAWKYSSMQEAILEGRTMAEELIKEDLLVGLPSQPFLRYTRG